MEIPSPPQKPTHPNHTRTHTPAVRQNVTDKDQLATALPTLGAVIVWLLWETCEIMSLHGIELICGDKDLSFWFVVVKNKNKGFMKQHADDSSD